jgi:16S rRNA (uracil1498-N3)-methyltransferase
MGNRSIPPLRSLPRLFVENATPDAEIVLPDDEVDKLRKVLRLSPGAFIAVLPNDGSLIVCRLLHKTAEPLETVRPETEPALSLTLAQALPKGDKLDDIVRSCTEAGISHFLLFPSERTVVRWDAKKSADRLRRLNAIAREAAELSFRTRLPTLAFEESLIGVLKSEPEAVVLAEGESVRRKLTRTSDQRMCVVVGPEGGWTARETALIGDRGVTLGPRVLRVDHAGFAAASILLLVHAE